PIFTRCPPYCAYSPMDSPSLSLPCRCRCSAHRPLTDAIPVDVQNGAAETPAAHLVGHVLEDPRVLFRIPVLKRGIVVLEAELKHGCHSPPSKCKRVKWLPFFALTSRRIATACARTWCASAANVVS